MKKYIAELIGTCLLTLGVVLSVGSDWPIPTVLVAGLIVAIAVYTIGPVSGSHLNPAITAVALVLKRITRKEAGYYMLSQLAGALIAMLLAKSYVGVSSIISILAIPENPIPVITGELVGMFFFAFGGAAVVANKAPRLLSGFIMAGSLVIGILIASSFGSLAILNPAVSIGLGFMNSLYVILPFIGAIAGAYCYTIVTDMVVTQNSRK